MASSPIGSLRSRATRALATCVTTLVACMAAPFTAAPENAPRRDVQPCPAQTAVEFGLRLPRRGQGSRQILH